MLTHAMKSTMSLNAKRATKVTLSMPIDAWELLEETLQKDAVAKNFDPKLRREIKKALASISHLDESCRELGRRLGRIKVKSEHSSKAYRADRILREMDSGEIATALQYELGNLLHAGRI